jgi:hypothetical protein
MNSIEGSAPSAGKVMDLFFCKYLLQKQRQEKWVVGGGWLTPPHKLCHHMESKELSKEWPFLHSIFYGLGTFVSNQTLSLNCENIYEFSSGLYREKLLLSKIIT